MSLDDRLQKNLKKEEIKRKPPVIEEEDEEDVETMMYDIRRPAEFINESKGAFDIRKQTGLNTKPSIFDSKAVFKVSE